MQDRGVDYLWLDNMKAVRSHRVLLLLYHTARFQHDEIMIKK